MRVNPIRVSRSATLGLLVLVAAQAPGIAQSPVPARTREWTTDLRQALAAATTGQRLTLVCFNLDGEDANERALVMYRSAEFRTATENVVCVLCSADTHSAEDVPCPRFAGCTCGEHIASEKQARGHFYGASRDSMAAQHLLLYPDGMVAWHAIYDVVPNDLFRAIATAEKSKALSVDQRLRGQRTQLAQLGSKAGGAAGKGSPTAYMRVRAILVQTPASHFCDALQALSRAVAERVLRDLAGHGRDQALALLEAATKHPTKALRDVAARLTSDVRARPPELAPAVAAASVPVPTGPQPLTEPLVVLGPADDFARVQWAGAEQTLERCRNRITVLWFFLTDAPDLAASIATMNEFATQNRALGIETVGLAGARRVGDAVEKLTTLGCEFPVGVYVTAAGYHPCGVERFPSWVVLDPDTNIVLRTPQDGAVYQWSLGRELALRMAVTPSYMARISAPLPGK